MAQITEWIRRPQSVSIILPDIRGHSMQAVNQPLTAMCSNHNWRSSKRPCNATSIVNPFSRLWILFPLSCSRTSIDLKLLIIAHTFPAYFFCNMLSDKKQTINENKFTFFPCGSFGLSNPQLVEGGKMWQKLVLVRRGGFWWACWAAASMLRRLAMSAQPVTTHR